MRRRRHRPRHRWRVSRRGLCRCRRSSHYERRRRRVTDIADEVPIVFHSFGIVTPRV